MARMPTWPARTATGVMPMRRHRRGSPGGADAPAQRLEGAVRQPRAHARFVGQSREESLPLLTQLAEHAIRDDFCVRLRWTVGTLAIWDNRSVQHYPLNDYPGERRVMHRVILKGEQPV